MDPGDIVDVDVDGDGGGCKVEHGKHTLKHHLHTLYIIKQRNCGYHLLIDHADVT